MKRLGKLQEHAESYDTLVSCARSRQLSFFPSVVFMVGSLFA